MKKTWMKWAILGVLLALPSLGWAVKTIHQHASCPITPDCPCQ